jgi:diguanylate cyclase (GGDEF)-like protein
VLAADRAAELLAEFVAALAVTPDADAALDVGVERMALAVGAQVAAAVSAGRALTSVGYLPGQVPHEALAQVAGGERRSLELSQLRVGDPGIHRGHAIAIPLVLPLEGHLVVARLDDDFAPIEVQLLTAMARVAELTFGMRRAVESEQLLREQSELQRIENAALVATLRDRQRVSEQLSRIQRAISRREPLAGILDRITASIHELIGADVVVVRHHDVADADYAEDIAQWPAALADPCTLSSTIAAPVHENGTVIGSLVAGTFDRHEFSDVDREIVVAFAEHASLALTDANTVEAMFRAFHDSLTGLASRALFLDRLELALVQAARTKTNVTLLYIDLDRFKLVNDTFGHGAGDEVLVEVAARIRGCLRASDTAARFGGDEFVVLLHDTRADDASIVAERIVTAVRRPIGTGEVELLIEVSIGVATSESGAIGAVELLRNADISMYDAKRASSTGNNAPSVATAGVGVAAAEAAARASEAAAVAGLRLPSQPNVRFTGSAAS